MDSVRFVRRSAPFCWYTCAGVTSRTNGTTGIIMLVIAHRCAKSGGKNGLQEFEQCRQGFCVVCVSSFLFLFVVSVLSCSHLQGVHPVSLLVEVVHEIPAHTRRGAAITSASYITSSREEAEIWRQEGYSKIKFLEERKIPVRRRRGRRGGGGGQKATDGGKPRRWGGGSLGRNSRVCRRRVTHYLHDIMIARSLLSPWEV